MKSLFDYFYILNLFLSFGKATLLSLDLTQNIIFIFEKIVTLNICFQSTFRNGLELLKAKRIPFS